MLKKVFKSPPRKLVPFLYSSKENWKDKYKQLKIEHSNLNRRHQYNLDKLEEMKTKIKELEGQVQKSSLPSKKRTTNNS